MPVVPHNNTPERRAEVMARREQAVVLRSEGLNQREIADRLGVSESIISADLLHMAQLARQVTGRTAQAEAQRVIKLLVDGYPGVAIDDGGGSATARTAVVQRIRMDDVDLSAYDRGELTRVFRGWRTMLTALNKKLEETSHVRDDHDDA